MCVRSCIKIFVWFTGDRLRHVARGRGGAERPVEFRPVGLVDAGDEPRQDMVKVGLYRLSCSNQLSSAN